LGRLALAGAAMFVALALLWNLAPIIALAAAGVTYPVALIGFRALNPDEVTRLAPLLPRPVRRLARV
jgi:hypothetical protein